MAAGAHPRRSPVSTSWSPARLPKIRDQMVRFLRDPPEPLREHAEGFARVAHQLAAADLWWVTAEMAALAVASATTLPDVRWAVADRPHPIGLIVWDGGIGIVTYQGVDVPVDAAIWGIGPSGMLLWHWVRRSRVVEMLAGRGVGAVDMQIAPPLMPVAGQSLPITLDPMTVESLDPQIRTVASTLAATWLLAAQPTLADRSRALVDGQVRASYARAQRPDPDVTLVDLRRQYVPTGIDDHDPADGRRYRHRWVVSGHWRDQPYGPGRDKTRRIWIADYLKGPDGAPLLATTRVNVWRR